MKHARNSCSKGFSLIEMMIVVVMVGILAAVAFPSYRKSVLRSHRALATAAMSDLTSRQEAFIAERKLYGASLQDLDMPADAAGKGYLTRSGSIVAADSAEVIYQIEIRDALPAGAPLAYTVRATPLHSQTDDTRCGTLDLTSTGERSTSGAGGAECWKR